MAHSYPDRVRNLLDQILILLGAADPSAETVRALSRHPAILQLMAPLLESDHQRQAEQLAQASGNPTACVVSPLVMAAFLRMTPGDAEEAFAPIPSISDLQRLGAIRFSKERLRTAFQRGALLFPILPGWSVQRLQAKAPDLFGTCSRTLFGKMCGAPDAVRNTLLNNWFLKGTQHPRWVLVEPNFVPDASGKSSRELEALSDTLDDRRPVSVLEAILVRWLADLYDLPHFSGMAWTRDLVPVRAQDFLDPNHPDHLYCGEEMGRAPIIDDNAIRGGLVCAYVPDIRP